MDEQQPKGLAARVRTETQQLVDELTKVVETRTGQSVILNPWRVDIEAHSAELSITFHLDRKDKG